jgi:large subunit ribosomal protein L17
MRHRKSGRRLSRGSAHRAAMLSNMLVSLVKSERIVTTLGRAKELSKLADKAVTLAKKNTQASITKLTSLVRNEREIVIDKLLKELAPRFKNRNGGYTRVLKYGFRRGDGAPTAIIEYLPADEKAAKVVADSIEEETIETTSEETTSEETKVEETISEETKTEE